MHDYEVPISYGMTTSGDRIEKKINEMNSKLSPLEDLRRIADVAEQRAQLAANEAEAAIKDAEYSKRISVVSLLLSLIAVLHDLWPNIIAAASWLIQCLQELL